MSSTVCTFTLTHTHTGKPSQKLSPRVCKRQNLPQWPQTLFNGKSNWMFQAVCACFFFFFACACIAAPTSSYCPTITPPPLPLPPLRKLFALSHFWPLFSSWHPATTGKQPHTHTLLWQDLMYAFSCRVNVRSREWMSEKKWTLSVSAPILGLNGKSAS